MVQPRAHVFPAAGRSLRRRARWFSRRCVRAGALVALVAGCGSRSGATRRADVGATAHQLRGDGSGALGHVATRVYREGISSERTVIALRMINGPRRRAARRSKKAACGARARRPGRCSRPGT